MGGQKRKSADGGEIDRQDESKKTKRGDRLMTEAPVLFVEDTDSRVNLARAHIANGASLSGASAAQPSSTPASGVVQHRSAPSAFCLQPSRHQHSVSTESGPRRSPHPNRHFQVVLDDMAARCSPRTPPATSVAVHLSSRDCTDSEGGTEVDYKERSDAALAPGDAEVERRGDYAQGPEAIDAIIEGNNRSHERRIRVPHEWIEERQASHEDHFDPPDFVTRASRITSLFDGIDHAMRQPPPPTCPPPPSSTDEEHHDTPDTRSESDKNAKQ